MECKFNETIGSYDLNGNIKSLTRTANGSTSDNFTYTYTGNQLTGLSGVSDSYMYDASGNLTNDPRKNLSFTYNSLNLLNEAKSGSTVKAKYSYSYNGTKMRVLDAAGTNGYEYLGSLTLVKTNNAFTPEYHFGEGIIRDTQVMYFEKDHLGSVRSLLNTSGSVLEKNDYYPFGMRHANASYVISANNRYKFNGKEDQTVGALGLLDYGARMYDNQIDRWLNIDPLAEKYYNTSPYVYCANNPVRFVDPDGRSWYTYQDSKGNMRYEWDIEIRSQKDLEKRMKGATYIGYTDKKNGIYYGLLGNKYLADTKEGKVMEKIDKAIINHYDFVEDKRGPFDSEPAKDKRTNFDIGVYLRTSAINLREGGTFDFKAEGAKIEYVCTEKGQSNYAIFGGFGNIGRDKPVQKVLFEKTGNIKSDKVYSAMMVFPTFEVADAFAKKCSLVFKSK